jgi:CRP-like cAMP-binding protein
VVDFTLTPALCSGLRIVTLWETLTLDLGDDPQNSIHIFKGMSEASCRIVAQMANLRTVEAPQPLMKAGESEDDMYVVIDGNVEVWVDGKDGRRVINSCRRGDILGEVGLFTGEPRSASADVVEDAQLLRLTANNLERLRKRHPRIASRLFRNLNEYQAHRLAEQTERLLHPG